MDEIIIDNLDEVFTYTGDEVYLAPLSRDQVEPLQQFLERCQDFSWLMEGQDFSPEAALDIFDTIPEGKAAADKFVYSLSGTGGEFCGVLEGLRNYPEKGVWWIGLLLLAPEMRGKGIGGKVVDAFCDFARKRKVHAVMLGVVEENQEGMDFWKRQGFAYVRQTEPRKFGKKTQKVFVMTRGLVKPG